jgi:hypothetical protein
MSYSLFYKRAIFSKAFDPRYIGVKDPQAAQAIQTPYLQNFERIVTYYAQSKNISKEEALNTALNELEELESEKVQAELKEEIAQSIRAVKESENEWVESGDKEKYPNLYLLDKLNEKVAEALNLPKEILCKSVIMFSKVNV